MLDQKSPPLARPLLHFCKKIFRAKTFMQINFQVTKIIEFLKFSA